MNDKSPVSLSKSHLYLEERLLCLQKRSLLWIFCGGLTLLGLYVALAFVGARLAKYVENPDHLVNLVDAKLQERGPDIAHHLEKKITLNARNEIRKRTKIVERRTADLEARLGREHDQLVDNMIDELSSELPDALANIFSADKESIAELLGEKRSEKSDEALLVFFEQRLTPVVADSIRKHDHGLAATLIAVRKKLKSLLDPQLVPEEFAEKRLLNMAAEFL